MGSCYSCKSGGGKQTYTTIAMATSDNPGGAPSKARHGSPSSRGITSSFGFRRRSPALLKSTSQERTSQLVNVFETKIASSSSSSSQTSASVPVRRSSSKLVANNLNNNVRGSNSSLASNTSTNSHPSYGFKPFTNGARSLENSSDPNCNIIPNYLSKVKGPTNVSVFPQKATFIPGPNRYGKTLVKESNLQSNALPVTTTRPGNKVGVVERQVTPPQKIATPPTKLPSRTTTQMGGLPRPQLPVYSSGRKIANSFNYGAASTTVPSPKTSNSSISPESQSEPMRTSTDDLPKEPSPSLDSGLSTNSSERESKADGDSETLLEVEPLAADEIASEGYRSKELTPDSQSEGYRSKETTPERKPPFRLGSIKIVKKQENILSQQNDKITELRMPKSLTGIPKPNLRVSPKHTVKPSRSDSSIPASTSGVPARGSYAFPRPSKLQRPNISRSRPTSNSNSPRKITDIKSPEKKSTPTRSIPLELAAEEKQLREAALALVSKTTADNVLESSHLIKNAGDNRTDDSKVAYQTSAPTSRDKFLRLTQRDELENQSSFEVSSPPSEKDTFLIDDEISDQPELIACQGPEAFNQSLKVLKCVQDLSSSLFQSSSKYLPRQRSYSACSLDSLGSDDMMLDFDVDEPLLEREPPDVFERHLDSVLESKHRIASSSSDRRSVLGHGDERSSIKSRSRTGSSTSDHQVINSSSSYGSPRREPVVSNSSRVVTSPSRIPGPDPVPEDGTVILDAAYYRTLCQDLNDMKNTLLHLQRVLRQTTETADTINPFEASVLKNGLVLSLAKGDDKIEDSVNSTTAVDTLKQKNVDLQRQVVFQQQQLQDKDRTIRLLQQQLTKAESLHSPSNNNSAEKPDKVNAACQTEKAKLGLSRTSSEDTPIGMTISLSHSTDSLAV